MVGTKRLLTVVVLLRISTSAALSAVPGTASGENQVPRNLWDHWSSFSIPIEQIAGMAWDGRTLWVLDSANKEVCCLAAEGRIVKRLPLGGNVIYQGLAFDGRAFWTWNRRKKCFLSITTSGNRKEIPWAQTTGSSLECVGGKLVFIPTDDKRIAYLDTATGEAPAYMAAPCRGISALAWDGTYLWCLNGENELVGYDARRQLAFTAIPLKEPAAYVVFGGGRFWTAPEKASTGGMLPIHSFPMPRHGDICLGEPEELVQVVAAGVANPHARRPATDVTVLIGSLPLDDVHQKIVDVRFNLPHSRFYTDGDRTRCVVIPNVTVPPTEMVSIHGVIRYTSRSCRYVILPDDMPPWESVPGDLRDSYTGQLEDMAPASVVQAAKEAAGGETHPYWKMRKVHDWILAHVDYGGGDGDPESVIRSGKALCGGYSRLTQALFRSNGIPCRMIGSYSSSSNHVWNLILLPGLSGWVDVDCMADDRDNRLSYITSKSIGTRGFHLSHGVSKGAWCVVNGRQLEICEEQYAYPEASGKAVAPEAAIERFSANTTMDTEPVCYGAPFHWRMRSGAMEIVWPEAYDFQDGTNLKYEIYASTQPMYEKDRDGKGPNLGILVDKTTVPYWRIQGLEPAEQYFIRVVAVDSAGNKSKDPSVSGNIKYRHIYRDRLLRRQGVWK